MDSKELEEMFKRYREMSDDTVVSELRKEIDGFLSNAEKIKEVILYPERYADGQQIKEDYLWNIGLFYERSVVNKGFDVSDKIFDLILYDIYKDADTSHLQYFYMKHLIAVDMSFGDFEKKKQRENRFLDVIEFNYERDLEKIRGIDT
ncbi:MAG: hypothetical protein LBO62_05740, partial [Endomicrobium sp.]|nr:hypothetical protein [Endomicrobium sp.]